MKIININEYKNKVFPKNIVYCGRIQKIWNQCGFHGEPQYGNPFKKNWLLKKTDVLNGHNGYLKCRMIDDNYSQKIYSLKDKTLACHCIPEKCHCETLYFYSCQPPIKNITWRQVSLFIECLYSKYIDWNCQHIIDLKNNLLSQALIIAKEDHYISVCNDDNFVNKDILFLLLKIAEYTSNIEDENIKNLLCVAFSNFKED